MSNEQLIRECRQGSAAAQKCLFDHFAPRMMMVCCRYLKNELDAEEALLDGFCNFFRSIHRFNYQGEAALFTWIKRIMVNQCLMQLRRQNSFVLAAEYEAAELPVVNDSIAGLAAEEIVKLIVQLPAGYRTVFNLFEVEGYSHREIATLLNITEGTSKSQLSKARNLLQKMWLQQNKTHESRKIN